MFRNWSPRTINLTPTWVGLLGLDLLARLNLMPIHLGAYHPALADDSIVPHWWVVASGYAQE